MEDENEVMLLQRYRRDRRLLLSFLLSGSLIKKVVMPPGAVSLGDVDMDQVSVDYVLNCAKKGETLELSEAIRDYHDNVGFPCMVDSSSINDFFLITNPESSGSPPRRSPPSMPVLRPAVIVPSLSKSEQPIEEDLRNPALSVEESLSNLGISTARSLKAESFNSYQVNELTVDDIEDFEDEDNMEEVDSRRISRKIPNDASDLMPGLPPFATGINDDDLRETAYEILLACAGASGGLIVPQKGRKDKKTSLLKKLGRSRSEQAVSQSQHAPRLVGLLDIMRVQMEVSEPKDIRTRQGLLNALVGKVGKRMDALLLPLELLCCISRVEFPDKKAYVRWQKRQLNMLEEGLINHPAVGFGEPGQMFSEVRTLLAKIEESEFLPAGTGESQRAECLRSLRAVSIPLAERPARGDLTGEVCHWADGYHLNVRLYEKLLLSVFDMLDEGKLTEEVEEILELSKSTWRVLGITETVHHTCYAWVLFRQFVITGRKGMMQHAIDQLKRIPLKDQLSPQERLHLRSLRSTLQGLDSSQTFSFLQAYLMPIWKWADKLLGDYHMHFLEGSHMEDVVTVAMVSRRLLQEEQDGLQQFHIPDVDQIELYITLSAKTAYSRVMLTIDATSETVEEHPLTSLAEETKKLLKKDATSYLPILSQWHPQATAVSASLLHELYGVKLRPFLDQSKQLTEDVIYVFIAADSLEQYVISLMTSTYGEEAAEFYCRKLKRYEIETLSGTLVMRWVNSQLARILAWIERAIQQERWDPISPQQRHGSSIIEVFRIVEETVDQFFTLKVPMGSKELNSLLRGIDNVFQVYASHIVRNLAKVEDLIPPVPVLTRYKKDAGIKAFMKKEILDQKPSYDRKSSEIAVVPTSTLCVKLNTLHYAVSHLNKLEDNISERWIRKRPSDKYAKPTLSERSRSFNQQNAFDGSRKVINGAIDKICTYTGTKIIFWDLRIPFLDDLYRPSVSLSRLELLIEPLDVALNELCDIIVEPLRDRIVTSLLQASLDGLLRVLLDGGPSRVFSVTDSKLLEEDIDVLKEFFISGGDGLPRGSVENLVSWVRQVIKLHGYETRELIEDLRNASGLERQGGKGKSGVDANVVLRILCHRNDPEASQFLKKQYKIPKSSV